MKRIKIKYLQAGFPIHSDVFHKLNQEKDETLTPQWFFNNRKRYLISVPFSSANEMFVKSFINRLETFAFIE